MSETTDNQLAKAPGEYAIETTYRPTDAIDLLQSAIEQGKTGDDLNRLLDLYERLEARRAEAAFNEAMAKFNRERPPVIKRHENTQFQVTRQGQRVNARYAALEDIEKDVGPTAARCGLSWRWGTAEVRDGYLYMPCIVSHEAGHSKETVIPFPIESKAGSSAQQKQASAVTYAERYTLSAALGLSATDEDNDGNETAPETITDEQVELLELAIEGSGADRERFLKYLGVNELVDLPANRFKEALAKLDEKKRKAGK